MADILFSSTFLCVGAGALVAVGVYRASESRNLNHIPSVGSFGPLGSYWTAIKSLTNSPKIVQEGYNKYKAAAFKIPNLGHWVVVLNRDHVDDIIRASDKELSFHAAIDDYVRPVYTFGRQIIDDAYHYSIMKSQLTHDLSAVLPDVADEIAAALDETLDLTENEWKCVPVLKTVGKVACRAGNRAFVGYPLCRDSDWIELNMQLTSAIIKEGFILSLFPKFILPLAARFATKTTNRVKHGARHLSPIIIERLKRMEEYGEKWTDKPDDFLQWCLDEGKEMSADLLAARMLAINFACNSHNVKSANPQYIQPLREEVQAIVGKDGWTKEALAKMRKVDSFLKEVQRFEGNASLGIKRRALKDITLSDGTFIPKGTYVCVASHAIHHDPCIYEDPDTFDPYRYVKLQDKQGDSSRYQLVAVSPESLMFGIGKAVCLGRFFAAMMLKLMFAQIILSYDLKLGDISYSASLCIGPAIVANSSAKVMLRRRSDE
ncbi:cytochrome P450 [Pisolithus orientalis]|uniref:cytochrome P450 n=1 Tax=Pisolithus orientalis TaxID=936130 RepID=UPI002224C03B|nr:cytochrome P450 [Pisolithus orientalis]KAI5995321.1 cytochrome P450 [Pisolithus orientalis]